MRLPQSFMSHHRRPLFLLPSRNNQRHSGFEQALSLSISSEVSRSRAADASFRNGVSGTFVRSLLAFHRRRESHHSRSSDLRTVRAEADRVLTLSLAGACPSAME